MSECDHLPISTFGYLWRCTRSDEQFVVNFSRMDEWRRPCSPLKWEFCGGETSAANTGMPSRSRTKLALAHI